MGTCRKVWCVCVCVCGGGGGEAVWNGDLQRSVAGSQKLVQKGM